MQERVFRVKLDPKIKKQQITTIRMDNKTKIFLAGLIVVVIGGLAFLQLNNRGILQGRLTDDLDQTEQLGLPDLEPTIAQVENDIDGSIRVRVTIENVGAGPVLGSDTYTYEVYLDDQLVFTNTDNYTEMNPGNKFSFIYPVDRDIYKYNEVGTVEVVLDPDNNVKESNEGNNSHMAPYEY